ncbi:MAG: hypothetical protein MUD15_03930 [Desulfobacterota bacterium]|jgi:hypothetical protein|nr:hypothetical protein [Thermodesulfobacteriota bacterium]
MDQNIIKQIVDFQKSTFTNSFNAVVMLQDQTEKMMNTFLSQATWVPQDVRKVVGDWVETCKKGREEFKSSVDENFKRVEGFFSTADKPQTKTKQQ